MKISASILDIKDPKTDEATKLDSLDIDYIHLDVMDGIFVENKTYKYEEAYNVTRFARHPKDVHLMVSDIKKYIDDFSKFNPEIITFHFEAASDILSIINYIHTLGIKAGIAINPSTDISEIVSFLPYIDLVLVMSVEPGRGGQTFIENSINKIEQLYNIRGNFDNYYLIEVDGGINDQVIKRCDKADICVVGSFITKNDYEESIRKLRD